MGKLDEYLDGGRRPGPAFVLRSDASVNRGVEFEPPRRYGLAACTSHASCAT
jgi:hypothetical protein